MVTLEAYTDQLTGVAGIRDKATGQRFCRVVAGFCWPRDVRTPGAVVALAEEVDADPVDGYRILRLAGFERHKDPEQLLELAADVAPLEGRRAGESAVSVWVGNPWHALRSRLRAFNERLTREGRRRINLQSAPGMGSGGQLLSDLAPTLTARRLGRKTLEIDRRDLVALIEDAGQDPRQSIESVPAVAALAWAVAWCEEHKPRMARRETRPSSADEVAGY